jgi:demethylmenaquinone methyltransferase/2-methoxy-6-polyprenyl-1,4-benzoquinol methylase
VAEPLRSPIGAFARELFAPIGGDYDRVAAVLSFGQDPRWRRALVAGSAVPPAAHVLDVATGTAAVAISMARRYGCRVTGLDQSAGMLETGGRRVAQAGLSDRVELVEGNAEALPFANRTYDAYSIAFGIRNVPRVEAALAEAYRVLRPGGRFVCLEFSTVDVPGLDALYELYSTNVIPALGRAIAGDAEPYRYLVESIRRFPRPAAFAAMIRDAGFRRVSHRVMSGGIVALHSGWRL